MKQILTSSLIASIVWTAQVSGQEVLRGPLARSAAMEAARLEPSVPPSADRWLRVTSLSPGTKVTFVAGGVRYTRRYLISASDHELLVLNVVEPLLPGPAQFALIRLATEDPGYFAGATARAEIVDGAVSVGPAGVFVSGRKVAAFTQTVERFDRSRVSEVARPGGSKGTFSGDFGGFFMIAGAVTGTIWGVNYGHDQFRDHKSVGGLLGGIGGYVIGLVAGRGTVSVIEALNGSDVLYRSVPAAP